MTNLNYSAKYKKLISETIEASGTLDTSKDQKYVIGVAISDSEARPKILNILKKPSMFTTEHNQIIWQTLIFMHRNGMPIEKITLERELNKIDKVRFDLSIYDDVMERGSSEVGIDIANLLYTEYCVRSIKTQTHNIYKSIDTISVKDLQKLLIGQMSDIEELTRMLPSKQRSNEEVFLAAEKNISSPVNVIPFPIRLLNKAAGGMTVGHTTTIAARTGHGKTTLTVNLIHGWLKAGYIIRLYQREQKAHEIIQACILLEAGIDRTKIRKNQLDDDDKAKIALAIKRMKPYYENLTIIDDIDNMEDTITDIVSCPIKPHIIIDDFIQLITPSNQKAARRFEIEDIMKTYHWLQKRYQFATVAVSQLSRAVETRQFDNEPRLSDLAEGASIEQLSENVILLWWDYKFNNASSEYDKDQIKFIFGKTRFGSTGFEMFRIDEKTGVIS